MLKRRPLTALLYVVILAGAIAGCGTSAPQSAATVAPDQPPAPATAAPAPSVTAAPVVAPTAAAPASPTVAATATVGTGTTATSAATASATAPTLGGASGPVPQASIDAMIADLVTLTGVDAAQVSVVSAEAVTWRDGSLGCPQPGMMYPQVLTEGFRVVLAADGKEYAYHGGEQGRFFYCANPSQ